MTRLLFSLQGFFYDYQTIPQLVVFVLRTQKEFLLYSVSHYYFTTLPPALL